MASVLTRARVLLLVIALVFSLVPAVSSAASANWDKVDPALRAQIEQNPGGSWPVIVEAGMPQDGHSKNASGNERAAKASERISASKGRQRAKLGIIGGASGLADRDAIATLSRDPFVAYVHFDAPVKRNEIVPTSNVYEQVVRATNAWALGYTGKGVGVAVLDSGVDNNVDLTTPANRLLVHVDLVGGATAPDPGGHGTHVAGIIAGNGFGAPTGLAQAYQGIAPGANIIDVRVIGAEGSASLSNVIAGIQWAVANRSAYNIRVLNLSLGSSVSPGYSYRTDPLVAALDVAWLSGITVVAAAGNTGPTAGSIESPGTSPVAITVGAIDDGGTVTGSDDSLPAWSSIGPTVDGTSKPDLAAPGRRIISLADPGSYLESMLPDRIVQTSGKTYFRLSGTSMAAPVVTGVAALLLEKNPNLKPDQIKAILTSTSRSVSGIGRSSIGSGVVDAYAALATDRFASSNLGKRPANAFARTVLPLIKGQPLAWRDLSYAGRNWAGITWDNIVWDGITWDNIVWDGINWDGINWDGITWDGITWDATWSSISQDAAPSVD